jgi:hypothetical protein
MISVKHVFKVVLSLQRKEGEDSISNCPSWTLIRKHLQIITYLSHSILLQVKSLQQCTGGFNYCVNKQNESCGTQQSVIPNPSVMLLTYT